MTDDDIIPMLVSLSDHELSAVAAWIKQEQHRRMVLADTDGSLTSDEQDMLANGELVQCIKSVRERTGRSLPESRDYVNRSRAIHGYKFRSRP